ncbi:MAG TPA: hypothetical protein VND64_14420 [Pirellulales bacterium]|nr:hypothetical protein [Pirellulales bacterium]
MRKDLRTRIFERDGDVGIFMYERVVLPLQTDEIDVEDAIQLIMEFARGGFSLVAEHGLKRLAVALARIHNHNVLVVPPDVPADQIADRYGGQGVFITRSPAEGTKSRMRRGGRSAPFRFPMVPLPFHFGMIFVPDVSGHRAKQVAKIIDDLLMTWRSKHPAEPVKVRITDDLKARVYK